MVRGATVCGRTTSTRHGATSAHIRRHQVGSRHAVRYTTAVTRPSISLLLAAALAMHPACKTEEAPAPTPSAPTSGTPAAPTAAPTPSGTAPTPATPATPAAPSVATATPASPAAPLDPLLDLVSTGADTYVVIRAPGDFIDGFAGIVLGGKDVWSRILDAMRDPSKPDADAGMRKLLVEFDVVQTALTTSGLHLERGMTISSKGDTKGVTVLAADDPESLPRLIRTLSAKPDEVDMKCKPVPDIAGFVACSEDAAALAAYAPGKAAATLRGELTAKLGAAGAEASNVLAAFGSDTGPVAMSIRTSDGVLQVDVRASGIEPFVELDAPGPAAALSLVEPGGSFGWTRLDPKALVGKAGGAPAMVGTMIGALSGEVLLASIGATPGLVTLVGLSDPTPIAGLIPMAALAKDSVPKELPDGSKLAIVIESADDGSGGTLQVLRAKIEPSSELATIQKQLGLEPEVTAFVTKQWAAIGLGTGTAVIPDVARASASEPSAALLASLPAGLAADLRDGRASLVMHLELDGLHAPGVREQLATAVAGAAGPDAKVSPADVVGATFAAFAPLSSVSVWSSTAAEGTVFHVALRGFGDAITPEGKAAQQARFDVQTGRADAAAAYGGLVTAYPASPRLAAYRVRAGQFTGAAPGAVAVVGVLAAIAIPAFKKYIDRSKEAGLVAPK